MFQRSEREGNGGEERRGGAAAVVFGDGREKKEEWLVEKTTNRVGVICKAKVKRKRKMK